MIGLTRRQRECWKAILVFYAAHHRAPTMREMADLMEASLSATHGFVRALRERGWLENAPGGIRPARFV
jgi:SOS-response transcriptional repressor LexA